MLNYTRLAAVKFDYQGKLFIRVFYQEGNYIKETYYDEINGWYIKAGDVVADDAKEDSPIAATFLEGGKQITVYFLNQANEIRQRVRITQNPGEPGEWMDGVEFILKRTSPKSQLTAVRSDKGSVNIRVFYQAEDNTIRGIVYDGYDNSWNDSDILVTDSRPGSSLSAIAGGVGEVRLFYQDTNGRIKEQYSDPYVAWRPYPYIEPARIKDFNIAPEAAISAVAWNYNRPDSFQIRLYSITANNQLVHIVFGTDRGGWRSKIIDCGETVMAGLGKLSAVASTIVDEKGKTYLFYQPQPNVIAQYGVNEGARIPLGIPTSLGKALLEKKEECDSSGRSPGSTKAPSGSFDKQQQEDLNKDKDGECTTSIRELHSQIKDLLAQIATTKAEAQTAKNELNQVNKSAQLLKQERDSARSARDVAVAKIAEISSEKDRLHSERDAAVREKENILAEKDDALAKVKKISSEKDKIQAERDSALAEAKRASSDSVPDAKYQALLRLARRWEVMAYAQEFVMFMNRRNEDPTREAELYANFFKRYQEIPNGLVYRWTHDPNFWASWDGFTPILRPLIGLPNHA